MSSSSAAELTLVVMGKPGVGKSTVLNALGQAKKKSKDKFDVGSGQHSCTQAVGRRSFWPKMTGTDKQVALHLIDTPGFPDPNPANAARYYDSVVAACNQPVHAVLWIVEAGRKDEHLLKQLRPLLREFRRCSAPVIVLVNGRESYDDDSDSDDDEEQMKKDKQQMEEMGRMLVEAVGLTVDSVIGSPTKKCLRKQVLKQLVAQLFGSSPRSSDMQCYGQLCRQYESCCNKGELNKQCMAALRDERSKIEEDKAGLQSEIGMLEAGMAAVTASGSAGAIAGGVMALFTSGLTLVTITASSIAAAKLAHDGLAYSRDQKQERLAEKDRQLAKVDKKLREASENQGQFDADCQALKDEFDLMRSMLQIDR